MKVLVIGGGGMLGHKLIQCFRDKFIVGATVRRKIKGLSDVGIDLNKNIYLLPDAGDFDALQKILFEFNPEVIINAVGVVKQHKDMRNKETVWQVNAEFPQKLAVLAGQTGSRLICISTDCVFKGDKGNYSENDLPDAEDLYGRSKFLGEVTGSRCLTIRTSIIGRELKGEGGLLEWFLSNRGKTVRGYTNAVFSGFPTIVLADILSDIILKYPEINGLYHIASNPIDKFTLLQMIKKRFQLDIEIEPSGDFKIDRSLDGGKFERATNFEPLEWEEMIGIIAKDPFPYEKIRR